MMHHYTEEQVSFIREQLPGKTHREMTALINQHFKLNLTVNQVTAAACNRKISNGLKKWTQEAKHRYTGEQVAFIREQLPGKTHRELTVLFNQRFGLDLSVEQVTAAAKNRHICNGLDFRFQKGQEPTNKGRKGYYAPGSEKGWFQKGHISKNFRPVGSERVNVYGYVEIKVSDPRTWRLKHVVVWERRYGKVPKGMVVYLCDGNKQNCDIENLMLVSRGELAIMNKRGLGGGSRELVKAGKNIAQLSMTIRRKRDG